MKSYSYNNTDRELGGDQTISEIRSDTTNEFEEEETSEDDLKMQEHEGTTESSSVLSEILEKRLFLFMDKALLSIPFYS